MRARRGVRAAGHGDLVLGGRRYSNQTFRILSQVQAKTLALSDAIRVCRRSWWSRHTATAMIDTTAPAIRTPTRPLRAFRRSMRSAAGDTYFCGLAVADGTPWCWGSTFFALTSFPRHCDSPASRPGTTSAADWRRMVPHGAGPPSKPRHLSLAGTPSGQSAWDNPRRAPSRPQPGFLLEPDCDKRRYPWPVRHRPQSPWGSIPT